MENVLRVSYTGGPNHWTGLIKRGNRVVWSCGHSHANRDQSTQTSGMSARSCAGLMLQLVNTPNYMESLRQWSSRLGVQMYQNPAQLMKLAEEFWPTAQRLQLEEVSA